MKKKHPKRHHMIPMPEPELPEREVNLVEDEPPEVYDPLAVAIARLIALVPNHEHRGAAPPAFVTIPWHDWFEFVNAVTAKEQNVETETPTPVADPVDETAGNDADVPEDPTGEPEDTEDA